MKELLHSLPGIIRFIRGTIHYRLLHRGPGDLSRKAIVVPIHSYRMAALPGRRRLGMGKKVEPAKVIVL